MCPTHELFALPPASLVRIEEAPLLGQVIDSRYALVDLIGGGGMGALYRGLHLQLDRPIAVKLLAAMLTSGADARARFEREAKAMSRLRSHHTVVVHDFGVCQHGPLARTAYMIMEYVEGTTLEARIFSEVLSDATIMSVLRGAKSSLSESHALGIIHRDIKPSNLLMTRGSDGEELVKLIDFGIARVEGTAHTRTGVIVGTPQYMAPEQCTGGGSAADARTDIYALAAVTFEMFTGRPPFDAREPLELLYQHVHAPPPHLPDIEASPGRARVDAVLQKALSKSKADRHASVAEFVDAVGRAVGRSRVTDRRRPAADFESKPARRAAWWRRWRA